MKIDRNKLAVIHIVKKELSLSDEEYRAILRDAAGVDSAKDLDDAKFRKLMNVFMRSRRYRLRPDGITLRQKYFIRNLRRDLGWDENHFENFLRKYHHKKGLDRLTKKEAVKLIESLKKVKAHKKTDNGFAHPLKRTGYQINQRNPRDRFHNVPAPGRRRDQSAGTFRFNSSNQFRMTLIDEISVLSPEFKMRNRPPSEVTAYWSISDCTRKFVLKRHFGSPGVNRSPFNSTAIIEPSGAR